MGSILVLAGVLLLMASAIWTIGEALKTDLLNGVAALVIFPVYSIYSTFAVDYAKYHKPFFVGLAGAFLTLLGLALGLA
jgi:hypothetical protein